MTNKLQTLMKSPQRLWQLPPVRLALLAFVLSRLLIFTFGPLAACGVPERTLQFHRGHDLPSGRLLRLWMRWDATWYVRIASQGYSMPDKGQSSVAFFPLFPLLIRGAMALGANPHVAALALANLFLLGALLALATLVHGRLGDEVSFRTMTLLLAFPSAMFLSVGYSESLYLLCICLAFLAMERKRPLWAGLAGLTASATRSSGILMMVPLAAAFWRSGQPRWSFVSPLLVPLGALAFASYLWAQVGDPLAFAHVQVYWNRSLAWPWTSIAREIELLDLSLRCPMNEGVQPLLNLASLALASALLPSTWRRLGAPYALFLAASLILPLLSGQMISFARFTVVLVPAFITAATLIRSQGALLAASSLLLLLQALLITQFVNWYFAG